MVERLSETWNKMSVSIILKQVLKCQWYNAKNIMQYDVLRDNSEQSGDGTSFS
jgi:hypothetical protein